MISSKLWLQVVAGFSASITYLMGGTMTGWISVAMIKLQNSTSLKLTDSDAGWLMNWTSLGMICAPFPSGKLCNIIGRRNVLALTSAPFLTSWIIVIFAQSKVILYLARFIGGIAIGTSFTACPMYVGEIADKSIRGALGTMYLLMLSSGVLFEYAVGPYVTYHTISVISALFPFFLIGTIIWVPESPYYYMIRNRRDSAEKSLLRFRREKLPENVAEELEMIKYSVEMNAQSRGHLKDLFTVKPNRKALIFVVALLFNLHFCGILPMLSFMTRIFQISKCSLDMNISAIIVGSVQVIGCAISTLLVDSVGRRILLLISGVGCSLSLGTMGVYLLVAPEESNVNWIPIAAMVIYITAYSLGLGPVPWAFAAEVFSPDVKFIAMPIASTSTSFFAFTTFLFFNGISSLEGEYLAFLMYSGITALGVVWIFIFLPETKGKPLLEIYRLLGGDPAIISWNNSIDA